MSLAVLVPTTGQRPAQLDRLVQSLDYTVPDGTDFEVFEDESAATYPEKINRLAVAAHDFDWLLVGADDIVCRQGWWEAAMEVVGEGGLFGNTQVIGTNDLGNPMTEKGVYSTHPLVRSEYVERGTIDGRAGLMWEGYKHHFVDNELAQTARARGVWAFSPSSVVEHMHPIWGKAKVDDTYARVAPDFEADQAKFLKRVPLWQNLAIHNGAKNGNPQRSG